MQAQLAAVAQQVTNLKAQVQQAMSEDSADLADLQQQLVDAQIKQQATKDAINDDPVDPVDGPA